MLHLLAAFVSRLTALWRYINFVLLLLLLLSLNAMVRKSLLEYIFDTANLQIREFCLLLCCVYLAVSTSIHAFDMCCPLA